MKVMGLFVASLLLAVTISGCLSTEEAANTTVEGTILEFFVLMEKGDYEGALEMTDYHFLNDTAKNDYLNQIEEEVGFYGLSPFPIAEYKSDFRLSLPFPNTFPHRGQ